MNMNMPAWRVRVCITMCSGFGLAPFLAVLSRIQYHFMTIILVEVSDHDAPASLLRAGSGEAQGRLRLRLHMHTSGRADGNASKWYGGARQEQETPVRTPETPL